MKKILLLFLVILPLMGMAQLSFSVKGEGYKLISAESKEEGSGFGGAVEMLYTKEWMNEDKRWSYQVRLGVKSMPLEIHSEFYNTDIRYTETVFYFSGGGTALLSEKNGDILFYYLTIGWSKISKSPYVGVTLELQGVNLSRKSVWKHNLNPYVSFGVLRGFLNESAHIQMTTGLAYKFY